MSLFLSLFVTYIGLKIVNLRSVKICHISSHFLSFSCIFAHISTASRPIRPKFLQPVGPSVKRAHKKFQPDRPILPKDMAQKPAAGRSKSVTFFFNGIVQYLHAFSHKLEQFFVIALKQPILGDAGRLAPLPIAKNLKRHG